jgi:NhaP-type Na+/H+ or K+/H+ antiporter
MNFEFTTLFLVGIAVSLGLYSGKAATKIGLPALIGYMILGTLMGTSALEIFPIRTVHGLSFITDIALGFVAFSIGLELSIRALAKLGRSIGLIIIFESLLALLMVTAGVYLLTGDLPLSLIFGSLAPATAPAGTIAVIQECKAKGNLTKALYAVAGFDDGVAIVLFGFAAAFAKLLLVSESSGSGAEFNLLASAGKPFMEILLSLGAGGLLGYVYTWLIKRLQSQNEIPALTFGIIAIGTGIAAQFHLSLILVNMAVGFIVINTTSTRVYQTITSRLKPLMPILFILFFFLAGAHLDISMLSSIGTIGVVYILARSAGKIAGARIGATMGNADVKIRKYLGLGLLSQAGVAIGLSLLVFQEFREIPGEHAAAIAGSAVTTIAATCIIFELIGPVLTKYALKKAGEIPSEN